MKKILILLLALVMCLGCFAACTTPPAGNEETTVGGDETQGPGSDAATLTDAVKYLRSIYKDSAKETPADYDVVGKVVIGETEFTVTWATDNENIEVKVSEKNAAFYTIDIPAKNDAVVDYKLTATVTDAEGNSESVSFDRALPVYDSSAIVAKPEEGVAYKFYMIHASLGQTLFATDKTQDNANKYIMSTTDPKAAPDFYVEADGEGFKFYTEINGVKTYVYAKTTTSEDGKVSKYIGYSAEEGTTWIYKSETNAWYTTIEGLEYVVGTYGSYNTFCISDSSFMTPESSGTSQFPGGLMLKETAESMTPSEGPTIYKTPEEIVNAVYALDIGGILSGGHKYTLTGVITSIPSAWSDDYGNITVVIVVNGMTDKPIECFRLKGDGASTLAVGDTITVTGELLKYDNKTETGKVEFNAGCTLDSGNGSGGTDTPDNPSNPSNPSGELTAQAPVAGTAYKFGFLQGNKNQVYYLTGVLSGFYMASTETFADGADFYVEATDGGFYLYCMVGGAKKYVNAKSVVGTDGKNHVNGLFEDTAASVYTYDETLKTLVTVIDGENYVFGTKADGTYTTLGPMKASSGCFYAVLVTEAGSAPSNPDQGGTDTPDTPTDGLVAQAPVAGTAYKFGFLQGNKNQIYYLTGVLSGFYMASTETFADGADFYVEATDGGFHLYCMVGGAKKYVNAQSVVGTDGKNHINGLFEDTAASVYTYDETLKTLVTTIDGTGYIYGTRNDKEYTTLGPVKADSGCFFAVLVTAAASTPSTPDQGDDEPETPDTPSVGGDVTDLAVDTPYLLYGQCGAGTNYLSGGVEGGRANGTTTKANAVTVMLEAGANAGEYYIYYMDGSTKTYISGAENKSAGLAVKTAKDDSCVWVIDASAKTIINKATSNRGLATQVASKYTNFSFYATSNFGTAEYQTAWFMAA